MKNLKRKLLIYSLSLAMVGSSLVSSNYRLSFAEDDTTVVVQNNSSEIDNWIMGLTYDKASILSSPGESIGNFIPKSGEYKDGKFIVVERSHKSLTTSPVDISIIDSVTDRTYPGALQLANLNFVDNRPDVLMVKRNPMNISIDLPGLRSENTITVENPNYANVQSSIDQLVNNWSDKYSDTHTLPARTQYSESMVYSKTQIASALNVNGKVLENALSIDFDAIVNGEKKVMVAAYKQIFYTVTAQLPINPSDLFDPTVTYDELMRKGVSNEAPPLMVSNVAYGRTIYVKLETSSNSKDVSAAFKALIKGVDISTNASYKGILEESTFTAVVLGGDAATHNKVVSKDFDEIRNVIRDNATFSLQNPAYPISYTSVFVKDNSIAAIHNKTDYVETSYTEYSKAKINLTHVGAYVAQFSITWDEVSYDAMGNEVVESKSWEDNWSDRTARFSTVITVPANARNLKIYARECTGLAWEWWRTVIDEKNVPLGGTINVTIGGTTLHPYGEISYE